MSDQYRLFRNLSHIEPGTWPVNGIGGKKLYAHGIDEIEVTRASNGSWQTGTIKEVLYVPEIGVNLISIAWITDKGYDVTFNKQRSTYMQKR